MELSLDEPAAGVKRSEEQWASSEEASPNTSFDDY